LQSSGICENNNYPAEDVRTGSGRKTLETDGGHQKISGTSGPEYCFHVSLVDESSNGLQTKIQPDRPKYGGIFLCICCEEFKRIST